MADKLPIRQAIRTHEELLNMNIPPNGRFLPLLLCIAFVGLITVAGSKNAGAAEPDARQIVADFKKVKGPNNHYEALCVGAGRAGELLRKAAVDHLKDVHENCGFQYLRFHGLFHEDMAVYSEKEGKPVYNFQYVDLAYDSIMDTGMKPFVELGFMPVQLASGTQTVFWWKSNVTPPKDYEKWGSLVRELTAHMEQRYGREEVKQWYFEVWNEPNHSAFFTEKLPEYLHLYDVSATAVKSVCGDYHVGGPATAGNAWVPELIDHCNTNNIPLDFISTHTYGVRGALDEFGTKVLYLQPGDDVISRAVRDVRNNIGKSPMPGLPLIYTEWSASYSSRDPVHDSYLSAAYILNSIKRCAGAAQGMSYWTFTDVFEEMGPPPTPFHGGFGLINLQGLHKPSYYAYKFLHELGDKELECNDASATVCRNEDGIQALVWNYTSPEKQDASNNIYFKRDLPAKPIAPVNLTLKNLPAGKYELEIFTVGYRRNDVYADFLDMGSPDNPTRQQVKMLAEKNNGAPMVRETVQINVGQDFRHTLEMRENDVYLVTLKALPLRNN